MSLVSSYIHCEDGKYYKNLVYQDEEGTWFLCFDDDEPPEIVIAHGTDNKPIQKPRKVLKKLGIKFNDMQEHLTCQRMFKRNGRDVLLRATSYFFQLPKGKACPLPRESDAHEGSVERKDIVQGVIYGE